MSAPKLDDLPPNSFLVFVRDADPNLHHWVLQTERTEDLRMAMALGSLSAAHDLLELDRQSPGLTLSYAVGQWLAGYHALRKHRDACRLVRALARHRETNPETRTRPDVVSLLDEIARSLDFLRDVMVAIRAQREAGDQFDDEQIDGLMTLRDALGTSHDEEDNDGSA